MKKGKFKADFLTLKGHTWSRQGGGRTIYRDGEPFIYIQKEAGARAVEADEAAQLIEYLFNELS